HKLKCVRLFVSFKYVLPVSDSDLHSQSDLLSITEKVYEIHWNWTVVLQPEASLIDSINKITGLLEFDRKEEGCRDVYSFYLDARDIRTTGGNLVSPECKSTRIGLTIKKINIVLSYEKAGIVDWIGSRLRRSIVDCNRS